MTLDPDDWVGLRRLGHRMMDDMLDHLEHLRDQPVWQKMPAAKRQALRKSLPREGEPAEAVYERFRELVLPYATGNTHPGFMGWVHGGGTAMGMLAELLAGGLNANLGGRNHAPIEVERQVIQWSAELLGLPPETSGLVVTGTSMANFIGVLVARRAAACAAIRTQGVGSATLIAYTSQAAHGCIAKAMDMAGLGSDNLRLIACDANQRMDPDALAIAIRSDREAGHLPFLVVGTAGTVDIGATDDLAAIGAIARMEKIWFHVDGAFGAMAALSAELRPLLAGIERADSVAFDFHKWMQIPYDAGCILVRDPSLHMATFAQQTAYLTRETRGLASGQLWPCDLGPDLSRGFRALKVWMTWQNYGTERLGEMVARTCVIARHLAERIDREPMLERLAPVPLNIVCFRLVNGSNDLDRFNREIVADVQEAGLAAPSTTVIDGKLAIRAAIVNHRTNPEDVDAMVDAVLAAAAVRAELALA